MGIHLFDNRANDMNAAALLKSIFGIPIADSKQLFKRTKRIQRKRITSITVLLQKLFWSTKNAEQGDKKALDLS